MLWASRLALALVVFTLLAFALAGRKEKDDGGVAARAEAEFDEQLSSKTAAKPKSDTVWARLTGLYDEVRGFYRFPNITAKIFPDYGRGLVSLVALESHTILFEIPEYLAITKERVLKLHPEWTALINEQGVGLDNVMALFLARVRASLDNPVSDKTQIFDEIEYRYIQSLPSNCRNAFYVTPDMMELLPFWILRRVHAANISLSVYHDTNGDHAGTTDAPYSITREQLREALCLYQSRQIDLSSDSRALVPFLDYINHVGDLRKANVAWRYDKTKKIVQLFTIANISAGEQLLAHYADIPGSRVLSIYGFYERSLVSPNSSGIIPEIPLALPNITDDDPLKEDKLEMIRLIPPVYFALGWKVNNTIGFAPEVLRLFRLLFMNASDFSLFSAGARGEGEARVKEIRGRLSRYVLEGVRRGSSQISPKNEEKLFDHLLDFCTQALEAIPTKEVEMPLSTLDRRLMTNVVKLVDDHRLLLQECIEQLNGVAPQPVPRKWKESSAAAPSEDDAKEEL